MERDRDEWRRPWTDDDTTVRTVTAPGAAPFDRDGTDTGDDAGAATPRPRPLAPPATWDAHDAGPGSPTGSVRPPDTVGTVDAPPRRRRRGLGAALLAGLLGAVVGTAGTLAAIGPDDDEGPVVSAEPDDGE